MYFINSSFFIGDIFIPNIGEYCDNMNSDVNYFISKFESEALLNTLGSCLFEELKNQLMYSQNDKKYVLKDDADDRWRWLVNGHVYTGNNSCTCYCGCGELTWKGFVISTPILNSKGELKQIKESFLAYWVYFQRAFHKNSHSTGTGEAVNQTENATMISNEFKRKSAFNRFVELAQEGNGNSVSLYQFINDHRELFKGWCPTIYKSLNMFDI